MRNSGLDEAQAGIKIARRNIKNLRYADDTTLMSESEEKLKSLLMKVKEESEKAGLNRILYDPHPRILETKAKINKWDLMKLKSFCTAKETMQGEKTALRLGENNSKRSNRQRINLKNIQATPPAQLQKNK